MVLGEGDDVFALVTVAARKDCVRDATLIQVFARAGEKLCAATAETLTYK
jgi:hypothetical protein